MVKIFDFDLEAKIEENSLGISRIYKVLKQLENDGHDPSILELRKLDEEMAKNEKVTSEKLMKKWLETYAIQPKVIKPASNNSELNNLKKIVDFQKNWMKENEDLFKYFGVI